MGLESEGTFDKMHDQARTPLEGCRDVFVHEESPSHGLPDPLNHSLIFVMCSKPSFSFEYYFNLPIDNLTIFVILMLIWAIRITCLICSVEMFILSCP